MSLVLLALLANAAAASATANATAGACSCDVGTLVLTGPTGNSTVYIKDATPAGGLGDTYKGPAGPVGIYGGVSTGLLYLRTVSNANSRWALDYMTALNPMFDKADDGACPEGVYRGHTGNVTVACPPSPPPPSPSAPPSPPPSPSTPPPAYICSQSSTCMGGLLGTAFVPVLLLILWTSGGFGSKCPRSPFAPPPQDEPKGQIEITGGAGRVVVEMPAAKKKEETPRSFVVWGSIGLVDVPWSDDRPKGGRRQ